MDHRIQAESSSGTGGDPPIEDASSFASDLFKNSSCALVRGSGQPSNRAHATRACPIDLGAVGSTSSLLPPACTRWRYRRGSCPWTSARARPSRAAPAPPAVCVRAAVRGRGCPLRCRSRAWLGSTAALNGLPAMPGNRSSYTRRPWRRGDELDARASRRGQHHGASAACRLRAAGTRLSTMAPTSPKMATTGNRAIGGGGTLGSSSSFHRQPTPGRAAALRRASAARHAAEEAFQRRTVPTGGGRYLKYRPPLGLVSRWIGFVRSRSKDSFVLVRQARPRGAAGAEWRQRGSAMPPWRTAESQVGCTGNLSSVADHAGRGCGGNPPPFSGRKAKALWSCQASPGAAGSCFVLAATREHGLFLLLQVPLQRRIEVAEYFAGSNHRRSVRDRSNGVVL